MSLKDWIYEKTNRYPCALPEHLRNWKGTGKVRLHNDWPWPASYIPRSFNARGPRCGGDDCGLCDGNGYEAWPPRLVEGKGIARWENAAASSILYIPLLEEKTIGPEFYGTKIKAFETNPGNPNFKKEIVVKIDYEIGLDPHIYSPSALQRWSKSGYLKMLPDYHSTWRVIKKNEDPFKSTRVTGENKVLFYRNGWRPDHLDFYYNYGPMVGLQMD